MSNVEESFIPPVPPPLPLTDKNKSTQDGKEPHQPTMKEDLDLTLKRLQSLSEKPIRIFHMTNTELKSQIQIGPKCGLVALSMASTMDSSSPVEVDKIFKQALSLGYTKRGEIFRVEFLADLAEKCCGFETRIIKGGLNSHLGCIVQNLTDHNLLLVPYDSDRNHSPCCKKGFKSHWAVISGFAILSPEFSGGVLSVGNSDQFVLCDCPTVENPSEPNEKLNFFERSGKLFVSRERKIVGDAENLDSAAVGEIYLIGRQGKSSHLGFWPFGKMAESNENLICFAADRNGEEYVLPDGGPAEGLKGKAIILKVPHAQKC